MNKVIQTIVLTLIGAVCFSSGLYYGVVKSNEQLDRVMDEYVIIQEQVDAFVKVSDPKTILLYVKQLNKILDDTEVLHNLINTGQLSDEVLSDYLKSYDNKLDELNNRFLLLTSEVQSTISDLSANLATDLNNSRIELESSLLSESDSVKKEIGKLYDKIDELYKELEQVTTMLDNAKETFLGKYIIK